MEGITIIDDPVLSGLVCPYCGKPSVLIDSREVYGRSYGLMRMCRDCDAYVGCHKGTDIAMGRLANKELRVAKKEAHSAFDALWKSGMMGRKEAYAFLSEAMGIEKDRCHIGMFDTGQCREAARIAIKKRLE